MLDDPYIQGVLADFNGLKLINDAFGHEEGDKLLRQIAKMLCSCCRGGDIIARTGGDEFCVLLPDADEEAVQTICRKIYTECSNVDGRNNNQTFYLSISLGYETKTQADTPIKKILKSAEDHMYKHKLLERRSMHSSILSSIKTTMAEKSKETGAHAERLIHLARQLGASLQLSDEQLNDLECCPPFMISARSVSAMRY
jgi:diguanylate cyclase (GGDEF)-like protein